PEAIKVALERQGNKAAKGTNRAAVVLVMGPGNGAKQVGALQAALGDTPVLLYGDTLASYDRFVADQKAMWLAQAKGPKRPGCSL
ncbi:MAG TPA: hypothetical protein VI279_03430, partial [Rhodocyclaceae bacterium]